MKISHFIPHFGQGGDWVIVKMLARQSTGLGHEVQINGLDLATAAAPNAPSNPFPLNQGWRGFLKSIRQIRRLSRDVDVLHAHSPICLLFAALARLIYCKKSAVIFTFHWPVPDRGIRHHVKRWIFNRADLIHVYSIQTEEIVSRQYGIDAAKVRLLHLGLPHGRFELGRRSECRTRLGLLENSNVIGYLGRLATEKNVSYLIRFFHAHHLEFDGLELVIAGAGDLEPELRHAATSGSATGKIHFLGFCREPEMIYPAFDILVLPSDFEAFALVVVEAAYCQVPTLRSDVEGSHDQIEHGVTGYVYAHSGGYHAMENELLRILREEWNHLPDVGHAARQHCLELCEPQKFYIGLEAILAESLTHVGRIPNPLKAVDSN